MPRAKPVGTEFRNRNALAHVQFGNYRCTHPACESVVAELAKLYDYSQEQQRHESQNTDSNPQSSMETVPCDLIDGEFSGEEEEAEETQPWARLMPLGPGFVTVGRQTVWGSLNSSVLECARSKCQKSYHNAYSVNFFGI